NISGGVAPYSVQWSNGQALTTIVNLAAGTYIVTVTDANGCTQADTVVVNQVTGISQLVEEIQFNVYPNPAKTDITVQLSALNGETFLSIKNVLGEVSMVKQLSALKTSINLSEFASGVYFVELKQGEKKTVKEIVVTK
ncbi:MAG: hypothetical protein JWO06_1590, partial [Bacteroidota bacterium]|nr:hypothetical protein [Bacteroidota bacterium]